MQLSKDEPPPPPPDPGEKPPMGSSMGSSMRKSVRIDTRPSTGPAPDAKKSIWNQPITLEPVKVKPAAPGWKLAQQRLRSAPKVRTQIGCTTPRPREFEPWDRRHHLAPQENELKPRGLRDYFSVHESVDALKVTLHRSKHPGSARMLASLSQPELQRGAPDHPLTWSKLSADAELWSLANVKVHMGALCMTAMVTFVAGTIGGTAAQRNIVMNCAQHIANILARAQYSTRPHLKHGGGSGTTKWSPEYGGPHAPKGRIFWDLWAKRGSTLCDCARSLGYSCVSQLRVHTGGV